jgi:hypothetical protein
VRMNEGKKMDDNLWQKKASKLKNLELKAI